MADDRTADRRPTAFVALTAMLAVALTTTLWVVYGPPHRIDAVVLLVGLGALNRLGPRRLLESGVNLSVGGVMLLTAAALVGPSGAAIVGAASVVSQIGRVRRIAGIFNVAMLAIVGGLGGVVYEHVAEWVKLGDGGGHAALIVSIGLPLLAADIVQCLANAALISAVISVTSRVPFRTRFNALLTGTGAAYVAYAVIAFLLVVLWVPAGVKGFSAVLILAPLLVARWALGQYGAELEAHNRTLTALVSAIEIKSPALAGHSAAVSTVCDWIADELRLPPAEVEATRTAGMLHDIGLLGLSSGLLRPDHVLTPDEVAILQGHSEAAARMLDGISFLDRAVVAVVHHHERFDGSGYPNGLAGDRIPLPARIVATADGFVALLAPRIDRPALTPTDALTVLRRLSHTVYDPGVVNALARALTRHDPPSAGGGDLPAALGSAVAHDEPTSAPWRPDEPGLGAPRSNPVHR